MKYLLTIALVFSIGCGADEQPLIPDEPLEVEAVGGQAPEGEIPTTPVYIAGMDIGGDAHPRVRHTGTGFQQVIVERDGMIEKVGIHFQKSRVYWFSGTLEPIGLSIPEYIYFNVLDDNILARPTDDEREKIVEDFRKELGIAEGIDLTVDQIMELNLRVYHNEPFQPGDEIEVVINTIFTYTEREKEKKMIFVDVVRNLTRPHVNDAFQ